MLAMASRIAEQRTQNQSTDETICIMASMPRIVIAVGNIEMIAVATISTAVVVGVSVAIPAVIVTRGIVVIIPVAASVIVIAGTVIIVTATLMTIISKYRLTDNQRRNKRQTQ